MSFLVDCKNEKDPIKDEGARVVTTLFINFSDAQGHLTPSGHNISPIISLWGYFQTLRGSLLISHWSNLAEFRNHSRFDGCPRYLQE